MDWNGRGVGEYNEGRVEGRAEIWMPVSGPSNTWM